MTVAPAIGATAPEGAAGTERRLRARVGWLVRAWRESSPDPDLRVQRRFSDRLNDLDPHVRIDPPRLSRWETGQTRPVLAWLALVEKALELPTNVLVATVDGLYRDHDLVLPAPGPTTPTSWMRDVHAALETVADTRPSGATWYGLGRLLEQPGSLVYLPPADRDRVASRLVAEVARSVGLARVQRVQAMRMLLPTRVLRRDVRRAIGAHVLEPHSQGGAGLLSLLLEDGSEHSMRLVSCLARGGRPEIRAMALQYLHDRAVRGRRTPSPHLVGSPTRAVSAPADLVARPVWRREVAAACIHAGRPDDEALAVVVGDALGARGPSRESEAHALLAASPCRPSLAAHAARRATAGSWLGIAWLRLLQRVAGSGEVPALVALTSHAEEVVREHALRALAHVPGPVGFLSRTWDGSCGPSSAPSAAHLHALGMTGHPRLAEVADDGSLPDAVRGGARWWQGAGAAIHELDQHETSLLDDRPQQPGRGASGGRHGEPVAACR